MYEIAGIENTVKDSLIIALDAPIDGVIIISGRYSRTLSGGCAEIKKRLLPEGKCTLTLYTSEKYVPLEPFYFSLGKVSIFESEEYLLALSRELNETISRIDGIEKSFNNSSLFKSR